MLFISAMSITQAQTVKPSRVETIRFINDIIKKRIGTNFLGILTKIDFDGDNLNYTVNIGSSNKPNLVNEKNKQIKWEFFTGIVKEEEVGGGDESLDITLKFSSKIALSFDEDDETSYKDFVEFPITKSNLASFKKAIFRLVEIAKEEHKDPFAN